MYDSRSEIVVRNEEEKVSHPEPKTMVVSGAGGAATSSEGASEITDRLDKVVGQLNIITKTLGILEQRMRVTEGQVTQLFDRVNEPGYAEGKPAAPVPAEEIKEREPAGNPLIEAERYDAAASGHFRVEPMGNVAERPGEQMEPRADEVHP